MQMTARDKRLIARLAFVVVLAAGVTILVVPALQAAAAEKPPSTADAAAAEPGPDVAGTNPSKPNADGTTASPIHGHNQAGHQPIPTLPWIASGRVTDEMGQPIEGASIWVYAGWGTMGRTGQTETDKQGHYSVRFGPGGLLWSVDKSLPPGIVQLNLQPAIIHASAPGRTEQNLCRQGESEAAYRLPMPLDKCRDFKPDKTFLPEQPRTIDFVLVPAAKIRLSLRNDADKSGPTRVYLVRDRMPPACSVAVEGMTNEWGDVTLYEVPTSYAWRFQVNKPGTRQSIRSRPFTLPKAREYDAQISFEESPQLGTTLLRIDRFTDPTGKDIRQEVVGDDPFSEEPAPAAEQVRGHELLRKIGEANRYWLSEPPADVQTWSYAFHAIDSTTTRNQIPLDRDVPLEALHGTFYIPRLAYLTKPELENKILIRRIDEKNGILRLCYTFKVPVNVRAPNGNGNGPSGDVVLVVDAKTMTPREHTPTSRGWYRETFADFVPCAEGTYAPRSIHVEAFKRSYDFGFTVYEPGLWLFSQSRGRGTDQQPTVLERMEDVMVNGQPGKARK
jgi:hypothetical protein